jgi:serine/threonine protein kinase
MCDETSKIKSLLNKDTYFTDKYNIKNIIFENDTKSVIIVSLKKNKDVEYIIKLKYDDDNIHEDFEEKIYNILKIHDNDHIVKFNEFRRTKQYCYIIYEFVNGTDLAKFIIEKQDNITWTVIKIIFKQLLDAVKYLHSKNIIHCDLKLENIMIDKYFNIKIIDFDLSVICDNLSQEYLAESAFGTQEYMAPESHDLYIYSKKSDVWSLGIILYTLITGSFPKHNCFIEPYNNLCRINEFKHINISNVKKYMTKKKINDTVYNLLERMLKFNEAERISVDDIILIFNDL